MLDVLSRRGDEHEDKQLARYRAAGKHVAEIEYPDNTAAALDAGRGPDPRRHAGWRRRHLPGHLLPRRLARPRRLPPESRSPEPEPRCLVLRGRRRQARPPGEGRGPPPDVQLLRARRAPPGLRAARDARHHRRRRDAPLHAHRLLRLLPGAEGALRGAGRARPHRAVCHDVPRSRRPLRHLPMGRPVQGPSPRRRPPLPGLRHAPRPDPQAHRRRHRHPRRARRRMPAGTTVSGMADQSVERLRHQAELQVRNDGHPPYLVRAAPARAARPPRSRRPVAAAGLGRVARAVTRRPLLRHGGRPLRARRRARQRPRVPLRCRRARRRRRAAVPLVLGALRAPRRRPRSRTSSTT